MVIITHEQKTRNIKNYIHFAKQYKEGFEGKRVKLEDLDNNLSDTFDIDVWYDKDKINDDFIPNYLLWKENQKCNDDEFDPDLELDYDILFPTLKVLQDGKNVEDSNLLQFIENHIGTKYQMIGQVDENELLFIHIENCSILVVDCNSGYEETKLYFIKSFKKFIKCLMKFDTFPSKNCCGEFSDYVSCNLDFEYEEFNSCDDHNNLIQHGLLDLKPNSSHVFHTDLNKYIEENNIDSPDSESDVSLESYFSDEFVENIDSDSE